MPATWKAYGVDGNNDGLMDPYNPVDAIFAAARYLKAAGADKDIRGAVFAYNHADWYVDSVLLRAQVIGGLPANLVGSLTGLTEGRFPVAAKATYARRGHQAQPQGHGRQPCSRARGFVEPHAASRSTPTPARRSSPSATSQVTRDRRLQAPRQLRPGPGRVRQHVHVRAPGQDLRRSTPRRSRRRSTRPRSSACSRCPSRTPSRREAASDTDRPASRASAKQRAEPATETRRAAPTPRPPPPPSRRSRSACSRTRRARTRWPPAAPSRSSCAPAASTARSRPPARSASPATRSSSRSSRSARRCPPAPCSAASARASSAKHPYVRFEIRPAGRGAPRDRPEADPRRLEAARVDRDLPRQGQEPVRRPGRRDADDRPDPADEQGDAAAARARRPADPDLRLRPPGHPGRRDRPPRAGHARVPRRLRLQPDRHVAATAATPT